MSLPRITTQNLLTSCKYGIHELHPVSAIEMKSFWKGNKGIFNKQIKKQSFKPSFIYNVICQHDDCIQTKGWKHRVNFKNFKCSHWKQKHSNCNNVKYKVVSYWSIQKNNNNVIYKQEYRLVNTNNLEYIRTDIDNDIVISNNINDNNSNNNNSNKRALEAVDNEQPQPLPKR